MRTSRTPSEVYQAVRDAVSLNQNLYERPQDILSAATSTTRAAASQFTIEGYRILRKIGAGGMAEIYLAATDKPDELQVLKVMRMGDSGQGDTLQRFMQEFALLAQVKHPNVAKIHRQDFAAGFAYIAMEHLSRGDLRARIAEGVSPQDAIAYIRQTAAALGAIHGVGIVHRDLLADRPRYDDEGQILAGAPQCLERTVGAEARKFVVGYHGIPICLGEGCGHAVLIFHAPRNQGPARASEHRQQVLVVGGRILYREDAQRRGRTSRRRATAVRSAVALKFHVAHAPLSPVIPR